MLEHNDRFHRRCKVGHDSLICICLIRVSIDRCGVVSTFIIVVTRLVPKAIVLLISAYTLLHAWCTPIWQELALDKLVGIAREVAVITLQRNVH